MLYSFVFIINIIIVFVIDTKAKFTNNSVSLNLKTVVQCEENNTNCQYSGLLDITESNIFVMTPKAQGFEYRFEIETNTFHKMWICTPYDICEVVFVGDNNKNEYLVVGYINGVCNIPPPLVSLIGALLDISFVHIFGANSTDHHFANIDILYEVMSEFNVDEVPFSI